MGVKVVKTKMTEKEVQSPGGRGGALLGREKQHTEPPHHPPVLPQQKRTKGLLHSLLFLLQLFFILNFGYHNIFFLVQNSESTLAPSTPQLINHRWVIPANDTVTLRVRFRSEELGQFDQTLNFEIMGTRRRYQLFCRGVCAFPAISREPRVVFPHRRKYRKPEEIVHKKYVLSNETFEFGPLLCGKSWLMRFFLSLLDYCLFTFLVQ